MRTSKRHKNVPSTMNRKVGWSEEPGSSIDSEGISLSFRPTMVLVNVDGDMIKDSAVCLCLSGDLGPESISSSYCLP